MAKQRKPWRFTPSRKASMRKAQRLHVEYVRLGKIAYRNRNR